MKNILVIGSGRWAKHLIHALELAGIPHQKWDRKNNSTSELKTLLTQSSHCWLAISDSALPEWKEKLRDFSGLILHSSGALEIEGLHSVHPLMSFSPDLYPNELYSQFAFVTTSSLSKDQLLGSLPNPLIKIPLEQKAFYHAMCVLAGNGSVLLWQKFFSEMNRLGIPIDCSRLYSEQIFENLWSKPKSALTGPLVRNDQLTLKTDLEALQNDPFQVVLASLISAYRNKGDLYDHL